MKNIERLLFNSKLLPMPPSAIPSFGKRNPCSINVYQMENSNLLPLYLNRNRKRRHKSDLLRLMDNQNIHFGLFRSFSNLIPFLTRSRMKHDMGPKLHFCRNCFQPRTKKNFTKLSSFCEKNTSWDLNASESLTIEFINWEKTLKCLFVVFVDLEAIKVAAAQFPRSKCRTGEIERQ